MYKDDCFNYYLNRGFKLVVGPAAPADNGEFCSKSAVYIKNYEDKIIVDGLGIMASKQKNLNDSINNEKATTNNAPVANDNVKSNLKEELGNGNIITEDEISSIVGNFQRLINNYKIATMHSSFGINVLDIAIDSLYSYEKEILEKYNNKNLYRILCNLKHDLIEYDTCKAHIIYTLESSLLDENFNKNLKLSSNNIESSVAECLRIINNYSTIQKHCALGLNLNDENDSAINSIDEFIEKANNFSLEERYGILYGIDKYFSDKNSGLPDSAVKIINTLRDKILEEKYGKQLVNSSKKKK